jgi:hypothetical protein
MRILHLLIVLGLGFAAQAAFAQPQLRTIAAEAGAPWTHKVTKMILPATAAGLTRGEIEDLTADERDLIAQYRDPGGDLVASVYIYQPGVADVAIWFDRAVWAIQATPRYGLNGGAVPSPSPFARPGAGAPSGLRLSLDLPGPELKSTAVAIAPLGEFLVKIRLSSHSLDGAALDAKMGAVMEALGWPAESGTPHTAAAMAPCTTPLKTKQAKIVHDDMGQVLMNSVAFISMEREGPPPVYCREPGLAPDLAVYRADGDGNSYVVALNDAGLALSLGPALSLDALLGGGGPGKKYSMVRLNHGATEVFPSFNRLPPPAQAVSVAQGGSPTIMTTTGNGTPD